VPPELVIFSAHSETESSNVTETPEVVIELTTIELLLKQHSAKDSQTIKNVRYKDFETYEWEEFPEKLRIPVDSTSTKGPDKDDGADEEARPATEESKSTPIIIEPRSSQVIEIELTVEGFKPKGTIDEINLFRQQSQARMDRRMSQYKIFDKNTNLALSRIQSV